jgi:hypothetical protein
MSEAVFPSSSSAPSSSGAGSAGFVSSTTASYSGSAGAGASSSSSSADSSTSRAIDGSGRVEPFIQLDRLGSILVQVPTDEVETDQEKQEMRKVSTASPAQTAFMKEVTTKVTKAIKSKKFDGQIIFYPPETLPLNGECPTAATHYLKPVVVCTPHVFLAPEKSFKCPECNQVRKSCIPTDYHI